MNTRTKCLNPLCENPRYARGLCTVCYASARSMIVKGKTSWDALEASGKSLPSVGRSVGGKFAQWLANGASPSVEQRRPTKTTSRVKLSAPTADPTMKGTA